LRGHPGFEKQIPGNSADLEKQAAAYRKLAVQRGKQYKLDVSPQLN